MLDLTHYGILPREVLKSGVTLKINVHVLLPQNETLIHYRKVQDVLSEKDVVFFGKIVPTHLYFPKSEIKQLYEMRADMAAIEMQNGNIDAPAVKATAASVLNSVNADEDLAHTLEAVGSFVQTLLSSFKKSPSVNAYDEALQRAAAHSSDPLTAHHQQVSSIAVLMAVTAGGFSMDDLSDLAASGLIHDLGLKDVTNALSDSHVKGMKKLSVQEKVIYMRHIDLTMERIKKEKLAITPGIQRIIEYHHENWNGSGFKAYEGNRIYRPARLMRIADDLVSLIQDVSQKLGFQSALNRLTQEEGNYDPNILEALLVSTRAP